MESARQANTRRVREEHAVIDATTLTREELHDRVSKANLNPGDCQVVGWMETTPPHLNADALFGLPADMYALVIESFQAERAAWIARNVELFGREYPGGKCEHCGNAIKYAGIVKYLPTGQHFVVGETCADERMNLDNRHEHDLRLLRMAIQHRAEVARRNEARALFYREHPAEAAYLFNEDREYNGFMADLARKLDTYGELSEKQLACVTREVERAATRTVKIAEREAKMAEAPALTEGRYEITGTVVTIKWQDSDYGGSFKMLVELADGNRVWGTIPASLESIPVPDGRQGETRIVQNEDTVRFTAAVERSTDDEHFGFYKRPTKAVVIL